MKFLLAMFVIAGSLVAHAQPTNTFPLWPEGAPGALGKADKDTPTLTPFFAPAEKATGAAMVICPGGGYAGLAPHEGKVYAEWLNDHGIMCFVLKYRLGSSGYHHPAMLQDAARALRTVRAHAAEWKIDSNRIGIIGSSAGGHLASTLLTHFDAGDTNATDVIDRQSSRPDLGILCYAVITMGQFTHKGSHDNLLGTNATPELVAQLSNELRVTHDTPPCFVWGTYEDKTVPIENSIQFAAALRKEHVPFEFHVYERGGHGIGLGVREWPPKGELLPWAGECIRWLKERGFAK